MQGEIVKPIGERWVWPFRQMKPGDWFLVDHMDREPERVRQMAGVRAAQMGKSFSVEKAPVGYPGYTKVTCVDRTAVEHKVRTEVDFETVMGLIERCYGKSGERAANQLMGWTMDEGFIQTLPGLTMIEAPPVKQVMVTTINTTALCEFFNNGLMITVVKPGMTLQEWLTS